MAKEDERISVLVESLESVSLLLRQEVEKEDGVDWNKVKRYMEKREELVLAIGRLKNVPPKEQKRIERLVKEDKRTIEKLEEMRDKVAAQMRRIGNQGAGRVLDTRG